MDKIDLAQKNEEFLRNKALEIALRSFGHDQSPLIINGSKHCVDCGKPIPKERLEARPDAIRCCPCQQKLHPQRPKIK